MNEERPILFSAPMVRAILAGRKTCTRRPITRLAGIGPIDVLMCSAPGHYVFRRPGDEAFRTIDQDSLRRCCPYGCPGDRLWVREAFSSPDVGHVLYRADYAPEDQRKDVRWRPSIHMPRALSRIDLRIADVRIEWLRDMREEDAIAEGVKGLAAFAALWDELGGWGSWQRGSWVWVIEFEHVGRSEGGAMKCASAPCSAASAASNSALSSRASGKLSGKSNQTPIAVLCSKDTGPTPSDSATCALLARTACQRPISSVAASPAKMCHARAFALASAVLEAVFGRSFRELFERSGPNGSSLKTSLRALVSGSMRSLPTWRSSVSASYRSRLMQRIAARRIAVPECFWSGSVRPTITANLARRGWAYSPSQLRWSAGLRRFVSECLNGVPKGPASPTYVEWAMGFPGGWTALPDDSAPSGMPSSRRKPKSSDMSSASSREVARDC